jgi:hypothetical protein
MLAGSGSGIRAQAGIAVLEMARMAVPSIAYAVFGHKVIECAALSNRAGLQEVIEEYHPVAAAVEDVVFGGKRAYGTDSGQARGMALFGWRTAGVPSFLYAQHGKSPLPAGARIQSQVRKTSCICCSWLLCMLRIAPTPWRCVLPALMPHAGGTPSECSQIALIAELSWKRRGSSHRVSRISGTRFVHRAALEGKALWDRVELFVYEHVTEHGCSMVWISFFHGKSIFVKLIRSGCGAEGGAIHSAHFCMKELCGHCGGTKNAESPRGSKKNCSGMS